MIRSLLLALALLAVPAAQAAPGKKAVPARTGAPRDWTRVVVETSAGGVRMGNPAARVKLIEYGSRTCPHCAHFAAEGMPALKAKYIARGTVSYEFRDYPIHNALDLAPILLGRCGGVQRFFPLLDAMMAQQSTLLADLAAVEAKAQTLPDDPTGGTAARAFAEGLGYRAFVERRGVTPARARACLNDAKAIDAIVDRATAAERDWHVQSTPTFILGGKAVPASDWAALEPLLRAAL